MSQYRFFDRIICINLQHRTDKKQKVTKVFNQLNIPVQFYFAKPHPRGGRHGCFQSHMDVIMKAYHDGINNLLIFEDDVVSSPAYSPTSVETAIAFIGDQSNKVDIFQFGYFPVSNESGSLMPYVNAPFLNKNRDIMKFTAAGFHAYCLTKSGMRKILSSHWRNAIGDEHFDMFVVNLKLNGYCYVPTMFDQYSCLGSDNTARSYKEALCRKFSCAADSISLSHWMSVIKKNALYISFILIAVFLISLALVLAFKHTI